MAQTLKDAQSAAYKAVHLDSAGQYKQALHYYNVAVNCLTKLDLDSVYDQKLSEYRERISKIQKLINEEEENHGETQPAYQSEFQKCKILVNQALDADEAGLKDIAVKLYTDAAELGLSVKTTDQEIKTQLTALIRHALDKAEYLKGIKRDDNNDLISALSRLPPVPESNFPDIDDETSTTNSSIPPSNTANSARQTRQLHRGSSAHLKVSSGSSNYTEEEKRVLLHTSHINDHEFVPFMSIDLAEKFQYAIPFTDKDGPLKLAPCQKPDFARWCRPDELFSDPKMVMGHHVDYYSIQQTGIPDCSFVASLAVSAQYEKRFGRRLITSIIYPINRHEEPVYNQFGKYMVKLHINGIPRKVIIDDYLPVGRHNQLLCSYSSNRGELWVSLIEKAYMKVMGGYDFPGSNSNIDLHALTGWIPDSWPIKRENESFDKDGLFDTLLSRLHNSDVLVTVATGKLSDADAERTGLVPTHAYAVLDVKEIGQKRLLQLKNPWSHLRWKGNYSELDMVHWTAELRRTLNYDPDSASQIDNGVFWIDYDSICRFYDVFYLNWNPGLFKFTSCIHQMWNADTGPVKDAYNIGDNPQFLLDVQSNITGAVWILLTRHITDIADFGQNHEYITVLVYKNNGKRVYYPRDPEPYIEGVRINSPHYLCKIKLDTDSDRKYTLVVSQYEKTNTIYYTLRAYGTCQFTLRKIPQFFKYEKAIRDGQWKRENNPRYQLVLESPNSNNYLLIILKAPKEFIIGLEVITVVLNDPDAPSAFKRKTNDVFRTGFVYLEFDDIPGGTYQINPLTYPSDIEGPFFLICKSSCRLQLDRIE